MCIYFKEIKELTYKKREHVIPAALGGKEMLPKGMVSDKANELFSKSELTAVREMLLSVNRDNVGPGKRGANSVKKVTNPKIKVMLVVEGDRNKTLSGREVPIKLGFMHYGKAHIIPQFYIKMNVEYHLGLGVNDIFQTPIYTAGIFQVKFDEFFRKFFDFINQSELQYVLIKTDLIIEQKFITIGHFNNRWFVYTNIEKLNLQMYLHSIKKSILYMEIPEIICGFENYRYSYKLDKFFDDSFEFLYIKTAFNFLALIMGEDFVKQDQFNELRLSILNKRNLDKYNYELKPQWLKEWARQNLKYKNHFVVIEMQADYIFAYVGFYSEYPMGIMLGKNNSGISLKKAIICDWENNRETIENI